MHRRIPRVVCAISGGVDSAVAALLMKRKGYDVVGLFMKNWDVADEKGKCFVDRDREDAQHVCSTLNIPLYQVNFVKKYWNEVFSSFLQDYENGLTPNPDVLCNKHIKFDALFHHAVETLGADAVVTGHYAKTSAGDFLSGHRTAIHPKGVKLLKALDQVKDQTLFLCQISQHALQKAIFPVGDLTKDVVKEIAAGAGMESIAKKKESMGICFIGSRNFSKFIEEYIEPTVGNFVDIESGKVVGTHKGTHYWTLGQRAQIGGQREAFFVAEVNPATQDIFVAQGTNHPALFSQTFITQYPHWIHSPPEEFIKNGEFHADFRFQHIHPLIDCVSCLTKENRLSVTLSRPLRAVTPGQYAVFYHGEECLGSGRITSVGPSLYALNYRDRINFPKEFI